MIELPYNFQNLDTSNLPNATDSDGDVIGKAVPASYLDANFQKLAQVVHVGTSPPSSPYEGMVWLDTANGVIKQYDGTQWVSKVNLANTATNADTVDNYHASQTPTANTIPVAGSDGKLASGWLPSISGGSGSVVFTSSGNWTVPQGVTSILIMAIGGGGGGGGARVSSSDSVGAAAGGGGYGGSASFVKRTVVSGEQLTITIGSGGSGGSGSSPTSGGTGGTTSVSGNQSGSLVSCSGGSGGGAASTSSGASVGSGRRGIALAYSSSIICSLGGYGGSCIGYGGSGGSVAGATGGDNGQNGVGYGCGGGGGAAVSVNSNSYANGGSGTSGLVVIWY